MPDIAIMREIQQLLSLLAERVYTANLGDATDFKQWLLRCSELAGSSTTMQEFFDRLPTNNQTAQGMVEK
jgi:hypothetical protein